MDNQTKQVSNSVTIFTEKGKLYLQEGVKTGSKNSYHLAIQEYVLAYKHALLLNTDHAVEASCLFNLGAAYIAAEYYSRGIDVLTSILNIPITDKANSGPSKGDILFNIGCAYDKMEQYDDAIKYYHDALSEYRLTTVTFYPMLCETLVNLGKVYLRKGDKIQAGDLFSNAAQRYFEKNMVEQGCDALIEKVGTMVPDGGFIDNDCKKVLKECVSNTMKIEDKNIRSKLLNEIGLKFTLISDYEEALICFNDSLSFCSPTSREQKAHILQNLGAVYNRVEEYKIAISFHKESITAHGELGKRNSQGQCFCNLAYAQSQLGAYELARESYNHALQAFKDTGDRNGEYQVYEGLAAVALLFSRADKAVAYYQQAIKCQALTKDFSSDTLDRLIRKLTFALSSQASLQGSMLPAAKSVAYNTSSRQRNFTDQGKLPKLAEQITEVDAPLFVPRPPSQRRQPSRQEAVVSEDVILPVRKPPQDNLPRIESTVTQPKKRQFNRGRRGYERGEDRPFVQVARGLSSITELSHGTLDFQDSDYEAFSDDGSYSRLGSTMPFSRFDEVDGNQTYQSIPASIEYKGVLYNPSPYSLQQVSQNLQSVSRVTKTWKKNGKRVKSASLVRKGTANSTLFEEPLSEEISQQPRPSTASRTTNVTGILKRSVKSSKKSTDLPADDSGKGGLSVSEESESESAASSDTDYAGRYRKQLKIVNGEARKDKDAQSLSSSSSSSDEEEDAPHVLPDAQVGNSMPVRTVPHPPEKPPRKVKTYEKPMQGPLGAADESLYAQSTKKNLRFSSNVKHLEDSDQVHQSRNRKSEPAAEPTATRAQAEDAHIYETMGQPDEVSTSSSFSSDSVESSPPRSSLKADQLVPPTSLQAEDGAATSELKNPPLGSLLDSSSDSSSVSSKKKSRFCSVM